MGKCFSWSEVTAYAVASVGSREAGRCWSLAAAVSSSPLVSAHLDRGLSGEMTLMPGNGRAEKGIDLDGGQSFLGGRSEMRRPEVPQVQGGPGMRMRTERESRVQLRQGLRSTRNPHDKVTTDKLDPVMLFPAVDLHKTSTRCRVGSACADNLICLNSQTGKDWTPPPRRAVPGVFRVSIFRALFGSDLKRRRPVRGVVVATASSFCGVQVCVLSRWCCCRTAVAALL